MKQLLLFAILIFVGFRDLLAQEVLIVADEIPAMDVVATALKSQENIESKMVTQLELPASLANFLAVIVYIHKDLTAEAENAFITYSRNGGKLLLLHHSISSAKRKNKNWFSFLGVELPEKSVEEGGYKYVGGIDMKVVNLAPRHFITTNKIKYDSLFSYRKEGTNQAVNLPGFVLHNTEAFLNHRLLTPRTILMGSSMTDKTGKTWFQDRSAWYMPVGKGWVFYSQPGHAVTDFEDGKYIRVVLNMILFKP